MYIYIAIPNTKAGPKEVQLRGFTVHVCIS